MAEGDAGGAGDLACGEQPAAGRAAFAVALDCPHDQVISERERILEGAAAGVDVFGGRLEATQEIGFTSGDAFDPQWIGVRHMPIVTDPTCSNAARVPGP